MLLELDRGDGVTTMICVCLLEIHGKCYYYSNTNIKIKKQVNMINSKNEDENNYHLEGHPYAKNTFMVATNNTVNKTTNIKYHHVDSILNIQLL